MRTGRRAEDCVKKSVYLDKKICAALLEQSERNRTSVNSIIERILARDLGLTEEVFGRLTQYYPFEQISPKQEETKK